MSNGTPEVPDVLTAEDHGPVFEAWLATLGDTAKFGKDSSVLQTIRQKVASSQPLSPEEQAIQDELIVSTQQISSLIDDVDSLKTTVTPEQAKAVAALPSFVTSLLGRLDTNKMTDLEKASISPVLHTLLFHTITNPRFDTANSVSRLLRDLIKVKDSDPNQAARLFKDIALHTAQKSIRLSKTLGDEVDIFLEAHNLPKLFEIIDAQRHEQEKQQTQRQAPPVQTGLESTKNLGELFAGINKALVTPGTAVDWDVYEYVLFKAGLNDRPRGLELLGKEVRQLHNVLTPTTTARERIMLVALQDPEGFRHVCEALLADKTFIDAAAQKLKLSPGQQPTHDQLVQALSLDFTKFTMKSVIQIHSSVLHDKPEGSFGEQSSAKSGKDPYDNPELNSNYFIQLLQNLKDAAIVKERAGVLTITMRGDVEEQKRVSKKGEVSEEISLPSVINVEMTLSEFAEYIKGAFEAGRGGIQFGYDLASSIENVKGGRNEQGGLQTYYGAIAGYARNLNANRIDTIFRLPNADLVQVASMAFRSVFMQMLYDTGHRVTAELVREKLVTNNSAIDSRIREELHREFKLMGIEDWEIDWSFNMARTHFFGIAFGFHETLSAVHPDLDADGKPTGRTRGDKDYGYRGLFNGMFGAAEWNDSPYNNVGKTAFVPMDMDWRSETWDHKTVPALGESLWHDSFRMGRSAFRGTIFEGHRLAIDIGNSLAESGGIYTNGGEAFRKMYDRWLIKHLDAVNNGSIAPEDLAEGWKRIENIGIDVVRNFTDIFVMKAMERKNATSLIPFSEFIFDRYFSGSSPIAKQLLSDFGVTDKISFLQMFQDILTKEDNKGLEKELMKRIFKAVEVVMIAEQMPTLFVTMEKQKDSEYGVQVGKHIELDLIKKYAYSPEVAREELNAALADISYIERRGRLESMREMDGIYRSDRGNLYGDLTGIRSSVRGGKGNVIDRDYIRDALCLRYQCSPSDLSKEVKRALEVYDLLMARIAKAPDLSDLQRNPRMVKEFVAGTERARAIRRALKEGDIVSPVRWMQSMLVENNFGHSITSHSVSNLHLHFSSSANNPVASAAFRASVTSETIQANMRDIFNNVKEVGLVGMKDINEAVGKLAEFLKFKGVMASIGVSNKPLTNFVIHFFTTALMEDDKLSKSFIERGERWSKDAPKAIVDTLFGNQLRVKSWDFLTIKKVADAMRSPAVGLLPETLEEKEQKWKTVSKNSPLGKLPGVKRIFGNRLRVRDWANELSAEALANSFRASEKNLTRYHYLPLFMMMLFLISLMAGKKGTEDLKLA